MSIAPATPPLPVDSEDVGITLRRWTLEEYHRAADLGLFRPFERLELIRGEIIEKMPQKSPHATAIRLISKLLERLLGKSFEVRPHLPISVAGESEPEPDIAVAKGSTEDYAGHQPVPNELGLVIEVSDTTLITDRISKGALYAENGISEYWVLNLRSRQLEVYRNPVAMPQGEFGFGYKSVTLHTADDRVSPRCAPNARITVGELLPPTNMDEADQ